MMNLHFMNLRVEHFEMASREVEHGEEPCEAGLFLLASEEKVLLHSPLWPCWIGRQHSWSYMPTSKRDYEW